jgi:hypothetical protein
MKMSLSLQSDILTKRGAAHAMDGRWGPDLWGVDPACRLYVLVKHLALAVDIQRATSD